jgi:hypothetical protein
VFKTIRNHSERKRLRFRPRIPRIVAVSEHARQFSYLGDPSAVFFLLKFHAKRNHMLILSNVWSLRYNVMRFSHAPCCGDFGSDIEARIEAKPERSAYCIGILQMSKHDAPEVAYGKHAVEY